MFFIFGVGRLFCWDKKKFVCFKDSLKRLWLEISRNVEDSLLIVYILEKREYLFYYGIRYCLDCLGRFVFGVSIIFIIFLWIVIFIECILSKKIYLVM